MACLAHVFEDADALDQLEAFSSLNGPAFYKMTPNEEQMTLVRREKAWSPPERIDARDGTVAVFDPMFPLHWDVEQG
jgi:dihydroorotase